MKKLIRILILFCSVLFVTNAVGAADITGIWKGKLVTGPGAEMNLRFNIKQDPDGSLSVVLDSPDMDGLKNVRASSVDYTSGNLKVDVAELNGSYEGVVKDGKIDGNWRQEGTSFPLNLSPYEKISREVMEKLLGTWHGKPKMPELPEGVKVITRKVKDDDLEQKGDEVQIQEMKGPDGKPVEGRVQVNPGKAGNFTFFSKKRPDQKDGDGSSMTTIAAPVGSLVQGGNFFPVHVFRFEMSEKGEFKGSLTVGDGESAPIKIIEVNENSIIFEIPGFTPGSLYKGKLTDNKIIGSICINIGGMSRPMSSLTLTKGE